MQVEDIPPWDVFYSPKHKAVIKQQRKRRRIDQPSLFPEQTVTTNVVWKGECNPSDDLTKLSQYAGAYSAATMDKASEVSNLLKEKDQVIASLQTQLLEAQQKADSAAIQKQKESSEALAKLKTMNEQMVKAKDEQIAQLTVQVEKVKNLPQPASFREEAIQINKTLITQIKLLCHQIAQVERLCEMTTSLINKSIDARQDLEQADETLIDFLT